LESTSEQRREQVPVALDAREEERVVVEPEPEETPAQPERLGDVLGLSDASPEVEIPQATADHSGNPAGIEVRTPTTGTSELKRGKGATGIQMGAGESGTDIEPEPPRPALRDSD
jgi:hypothetical protein